MSAFRILVTYYVTTGATAAGLVRGAEGSGADVRAASVAAATPGPRAAFGPEAPGEAPPEGDWFELARQWFELFAPPDVKAQYEFPSRERWDTTVRQWQQALAGDSLGEMAALAAEARSTLRALRLMPGTTDLADWLEQRIDEIEGAQQALRPPPVPPSGPQPPRRPGAPVPAAVQPVPHYNLWLARVRGRPLPARARELMPRLQAAFRAEGVPAELAWVAEAESSLNPTARSPVGAKGLFQFMPETARALGLSTFLPDDRTDPERSSRAAARYLKQLHGRFGNWALALAAYNAGEGRVGRTLVAQRASTFTAIADALPAETRMYVPKVCALIATRTGVTPDRIAPPR